MVGITNDYGTKPKINMFKIYEKAIHFLFQTELSINNKWL